MTLTTKFKKDISTLRAAANKEIFLDVKNPKLYKKVKRYYQNEVVLTGVDITDYGNDLPGKPNLFQLVKRHLYKGYLHRSILSQIHFFSFG